MRILENPEYALAGYYDYYGKAAVVWISSFGDLLGSIYDPGLRTFIQHQNPRQLALDGLRIDRVAASGLIRATTHKLSQNDLCEICGQQEKYILHNECGDAILTRLEEPPDPDGTNWRFRDAIMSAIEQQLTIEAKGPPPTGLRLVTILYYWMVAFPEVEGNTPLKWEVLQWALKGRVKETIKYLETIRTTRAEKVLGAILAYRDHQFKRPASFSCCWRLSHLKKSFGWIREELEKPIQ